MYACSLPGFGPSEKTPQLYTTAVWSAFVRDFVINVVRRPVVVAGNSIGGGIPAVAAANHAHLFEGVVLVNTAGSTDGGPWDPNNVPVKKVPSRLFVGVVSRCGRSGWRALAVRSQQLRSTHVVFVRHALNASVTSHPASCP